MAASNLNPCLVQGKGNFNFSFCVLAAEDLIQDAVAFRVLCLISESEQDKYYCECTIDDVQYEMSCKAAGRNASPSRQSNRERRVIDLPQAF